MHSLNTLASVKPKYSAKKKVIHLTKIQFYFS